MAHLVTCRTLFDISATGVRGHYNSGRIPFKDDQDQLIQTQADWERSRNQQRNWETLNQIISLRVLPESISLPTVISASPKTWHFEFALDNIASIQSNEDPAGILAADADNVPMIVNLDEDHGIRSWIVVQGPETNTWFTVEQT
jgi:hypothetical protein